MHLQPVDITNFIWRNEIDLDIHEYKGCTTTMFDCMQIWGTIWWHGIQVSGWPTDMTLHTQSTWDSPYGNCADGQRHMGQALMITLSITIMILLYNMWTSPGNHGKYEVEFKNQFQNIILSTWPTLRAITCNYRNPHAIWVKIILRTNECSLYVTFVLSAVKLGPGVPVIINEKGVTAP